MVVLNTLESSGATTMSKLSVCIAAFNMATLLPNLLDSLKEQTFKDFTVYVSYNGSTDNTLEILERYQNELSLVIVDYDPTSGIGLNKRDAVVRALLDNPRYIQMIDADDIILPRFFEAVVERMDKGDIDWCICWGYLFGDRTGYIHSEIESLEKLLEHNNLHSWGTFKSDVLRNHNYDPSITYAEDWDLWIRLNKLGYKGDTVNQELYLKRWHDKSLTITHTKIKENKTMRFHLISLSHLPQHKKFNGCAFSMKNRKLAKMLTSLGHEVFFYGSEGSDVEEYVNNDKLHFIETHKLADIRNDYGDGFNLDEYPSVGYDTFAHEFRHDFNTNPKKSSTLKFYHSCIDEINKRKRPDDFLLLSQGFYHKPISDAVQLYLTCEPGIGYRGSMETSFRAFESSYIQNFTYGSEHPFESINGRTYDRVIPNYFDPADFSFSEEKDDYYLYIGRMIKRKGIITAAKACNEISAKLLIAGQGAHVDERGYLVPNDNPDFELEPGTWEYIGFADIEKRKSLMARAKATFVPSEYLEPFAGTHIESMLSGTPCITTSFGVFSDTVQNGVNGYRCNTLDDFVWAAKEAPKLDPLTVRKSGERCLMDSVKYDFQRWFDDLYAVWESTQNDDVKGWHRIRDEQPEWRKRITW